jgi:hypothetical protein
MSAYGYLQIFWPDDPVESFILPKAVIAIGRSSGNDLVIDREGISRYHAKLMVEDQQAMLTDLASVNGVYVDGSRLEAETPRPLKGGEEVQIADVRLVYYPDALTEETSPFNLEDTAQNVRAGLLSVQVTAPESEVVPGSHLQSSLAIENLSESVQIYTLQVIGIPKEWLRLQRSEIELDPGSQTTVIANFKPLRRSETAPKVYPLIYIVTPKNDPATAVQVESSLAVGVYSGYGVAMGTAKITGSQAFEMHIHNQGNGPLALKFSGRDKQQALAIQLNPPEVVLAAGERRSILGTVRPKKGGLIGSPRTYRYDVLSSAQDASGFVAAVSGDYTSKPLLPGWLSILLIPVLAIVAILAITLGLSLLGEGDAEAPPPAPQVISFGLNRSAGQAEALANDPLELVWAVANSDSLSLQYSRAGQAPSQVFLSPNQSSHRLVLPNSGVYDVRLLAENERGQAVQSLEVRVLPQVELILQPATLIRDVSQNIQLRWQVTGADPAANLTLVNQAAGLNESLSPDPAGPLTYTIRPASEGASTAFILTVPGLDGTQGQDSFEAALSEPQCRVSVNGGQAVYAGPGQNYPPIAGVTYGPGEQLRPLARNAGGDWVQLRHQSDLAWAPAASLTCEGFTVMDLSELPAAAIPPSPTPSSSPSPVPTSTPSPIPSRTPRPTES